jgi:hypothetical protein
MAGVRIKMVLLSSLQRSWGGYDLIFGARDENTKGDQFSFVKSITGDLRISIGNPTLAQKFAIGKIYNVDVSIDEVDEKETNIEG